MKLRDWLKQQKMTQAKFARLIRTDQGHVSDLVTGKVQPSLPTIVVIEKATKGQVAYQDWK